MSNPTSILDLFRLEGKTAIITGASKGLGEAIAIALAQAGANLILASRTESEIKASAERIAEMTGRLVVGVVADVRLYEYCVRVVGVGLEHFPQIDILVNSAGVNNRKPIHELSVSEFEDLIDINLTGSYRMCKACTEGFMQQRSGKVINLSSMLDRVTIPGRTGYSASKAGVLMMTKALALEWAPYNIQVNALSPGPFATPLNRVILEDPQRSREFLQKIPLGRFGEPYEVGAAVLYLASPAANFVTGTTLYIDGGWTAQ
ncbi:MAG: SDR family NAD(P)-dependent oxidoreductase [Deinococcales bacterium]